MEAFVDPITLRPVQNITIAEGETKIVGLKKFALGPPREVEVSTLSPVAFCNRVSRLKDPTKRKYSSGHLRPNDYHWYKMSSFPDEMVPVEINGHFFFQIGGHAAGRTELTAVSTKTRTAVADPLSIVVTENKRRLSFNAAPGFPSPTFNLLWKNHPLNPNNPGGPDGYPCKIRGKDGEKYSHGHNQCMVRFCTALERSGASFSGLHSSSMCNLGGDEHRHNFLNPYDFEPWKKSKGSHYVWEAKPPFEKEPMPGLAAFMFMYNRRGVVLFWNYHMKNMFGGHIDLWNLIRMGNNFTDLPTETFMDGEGAFYRARKIVFWPMD
jgi:Type VI secretion system (T6SS), amidase effector protein 4